MTPSTDSPLTKVGSTSGEFELWERDASWSPDGQRILFTGDRNLSCQNSSYVHSGVELFSMNADGSSTTKIWTPWNVELGFVGSSWQPCAAVTLTCAPVPPPDADGDGLPDPVVPPPSPAIPPPAIPPPAMPSAGDPARDRPQPDEGTQARRPGDQGHRPVDRSKRQRQRRVQVSWSTSAEARTRR